MVCRGGRERGEWCVEGEGRCVEGEGREGSGV